jgi:hypothetical protein
MTREKDTGTSLRLNAVLPPRSLCVPSQTDLEEFLAEHCSKNAGSPE